jgi:3-isopropylmalate dehydrogenase
LEKTGRKLVDGLDLMVVRELTGGVTYESERIGRVAFEFAGQRRDEVTSSDERNVMESGVLWDEVITALRAREYPDVEPFAISNNTEGSQPDTTKQIRGSRA